MPFLMSAGLILNLLLVSLANFPSPVLFEYNNLNQNFKLLPSGSKFFSFSKLCQEKVRTEVWGGGISVRLQGDPNFSLSMNNVRFSVLFNIC